MTLSRAVILLALVQLVFAVIVLWDFAANILGLRKGPASWAWIELVQLLAGAGLMLGVILGVVLTRRILRESLEARERSARASSAFGDVVEARMSEWNLTRSERDVAIFLLKGMSNAEIAALRETSEGTVKAQVTAVFRKADVAGRPQFLTLFIDDLFDGAHIRPALRAAE